MNAWPVFVVVAVVLLLGVFAMRRMSQRKVLLATMQRNTERQGAILSIMERISDVLKDPSLSAAEARVATGLLITELRAMDDDGILAPLIADNERYIEEQLAKRAE